MTKSEDIIRDALMIENGNELTIERKKVSVVSKVLAMIWWLSSGWSTLCIYTCILSIISLSIVMYMKLIELLPFCLYDNWYYLCYYLVLTLFSALMLPLISTSHLFDYESKFWKYSRRLGAYFWYLEIEGLAYVLVYYKDIVYDLEYDDEAQLLVWTLLSVSFIRFTTITIAYWTATKTLNRITSKNKLPKNYFGSTFSDFCDLFVLQTCALTLYLSSFNLYTFGFVLSVAYFYVSFARL